MGRRLVLGTAAVTLLALLPTPVAEAQSKDPAAMKLACVQASDKAQQLRVAGKLVAARSALTQCVADACPNVVREACSQWLGEVNASLPSIVIGAKDSEGKDLLDLRVSIDGELVTEHLGGRALPIDPGRHKMRYEKADGAVVEEEILVGEGTKNRPVSVVFPGPAPAVVPASGVPAGAVATHRVASTGNTVAGTILVAAGVGALGTALYLDLSATSDINSFKTTCAPHCSTSQVNAEELKYDMAGVTLGVGIVAVGIATYVFLGHPFGDTVPVTATSRLRVVPSPHGSGLALTF
jgi:hypothetical protein